KFGLKDRSGALVDDVMPDTPAAKAGIQHGDVVVEFNGKKVPDQRQLRLWASQTPPNTKVTLKVLRDGKEMRFSPTLGELPAELFAANAGPERSAQKKSEALDGVEVTDLDRATRRQEGIAANV